MKVVAFDGSSNPAQSPSSALLRLFLEGLSDAGTDVKHYLLSEMVVNPCGSCLGCWVVSPGRCLQNDAMNSLYPDLRSADVWVIATPVHGHRLAGSAQNLIDRMLPLTTPNLELRKGHSRLGLRYKSEDEGKVVLIADCALWESDNLDVALTHVAAMADTVGRSFAGALLRPHSWALTRPGGVATAEVRAAARDAGSQLATSGEMSPSTLATVSRQLMPLGEALAYFNEIAEEEVARGRSDYLRSHPRPGILKRILEPAVDWVCRKRLSAAKPASLPHGFWPAR